MAEVTITIEKNEMHYDAKECDIKTFAAIANASLHHMEIMLEGNSENLDIYIKGIKNSVKDLEAKYLISKTYVP